MTHPTSLTWPDGYADWHGSFDELVATAQRILGEAGGQAALSPSLVRHYQSVGLVGRGVKEGRSAKFGVEDLAAVLATKGLVKQGLSLDVAQKVMAYAPELPSAFYANTVASPPSQDHGPTPAAVGAVAALMAQAGLGGGLAMSNGYVTSASPRVRAALPTAAASTVPSPSRTLLASLGPSMLRGASRPEEHRPTPWLTVYLDPEAARAAPDHERTLAALRLREMAASIDPTPLFGAQP